MKKLIFVVAVAIIAAVSCSKTYETRTSNSEGTPIMLGSWADNLTKARTVGASSFADGDKFFAYAYTSTGQTPFEGTEVSFDGTSWSYSPLRFWDRNNDSYSFYGISPSENVTAASLVYGNWVDGTFQSNSVTLSGANNDILVADKKVVEKAHYGETVELNFRHINALFDLKVRKGSGIGDNGVLKVTGVSLENIDATGYFTVDSYDGTSNAANVTWHSTAAASYTDASGVNTVTTVSAATPITTTGDQYLINNLVVMPQTFAASAQRLKISYTITTGTGATEQVNTFTDKTYDLVLFDNTDYPTDDNAGEAGNQYNEGTNVSGFVGGVHYTYIITIDAETITFNATMTDWTTDNGYYYILN